MKVSDTVCLGTGLVNSVLCCPLYRMPCPDFTVKDVKIFVGNISPPSGPDMFLAKINNIP